MNEWAIISHFFFIKIMKDLIIKTIETFIKSNGLMYIDSVIRGERATKVLEVYVDDIEPLSFDKIAKISSDAWSELEKNGMSSDISKIVVSSPGVDKSFKYPEQLFKHIGRILDIKLMNGRNLSGELVGITNNDSTFLIEIKVKEKIEKKTSAEIESFDFNEIAESKVKLKFK